MEIDLWSRVKKLASVAEAEASENQLLHMISERKRRKKHNDCFHALKTVLPPGSKVWLIGYSCLYSMER
jgi:hypothetical protein